MMLPLISFEEAELGRNYGKWWYISSIDYDNREIGIVQNGTPWGDRKREVLVKLP
jgi:hypothetical protein